MLKLRMETWLTMAALGAGVVVTGIAALFAFMSLTATPIHSSAEAVPASAAPLPAPRWAEAIERGRDVLRTGLVDRNLPGVSVAVGVDGTLVWAEGMGWADIEGRVPVTPQTRFRIGSMATLLTSAGVGLLLEQGDLDLDAEIQAYVPDFPRKQWPVTLRELMAHTAGVRDDAGDEEPLSPHCDTAADGLTRFADRPLLFEPGTAYRYSSYGWRLVSAAIEGAAGESFFTFMRRRVFEPLDLQDTRGDVWPEPVADQAVTYFPRFAADTRYGPQGQSLEDHSCFSGSSAFLSTPSDLVRFVMAVEGGRLLQPATVKLLQAPVALPDGADTGYGLGWDLETIELAGAERRLVVQDGVLRGGMVTSLISFPDQRLVVAVFANTSFAQTAPIAHGIAEAFAAVTPSQARR